MKRGEIWTVDLNPGFGREVRKKRPALIISPDIYNKQLFTIVTVPFSSQVPRLITPEMVLVAPDKINNLEKKSVLLPVFIKAVDKSRFIKKVGKLTADKLAEVEYALKIVLGLEPLV